MLMLRLPFLDLGNFVALYSYKNCLTTSKKIAIKSLQGFTNLASIFSSHVCITQR